MSVQKSSVSDQSLNLWSQEAAEDHKESPSDQESEAWILDLKHSDYSSRFSQFYSFRKSRKDSKWMRKTNKRTFSQVFTMAPGHRIKIAYIVGG